jgi:DNA gyrase/topoisomerase IV subunit A
MSSINAKDIAKEYTASYASYVATSRAIPSLVDGLKPVQRRCINSADDLKLYHDKKFLKVAKLEGQVMGDYHPHGGASPVILAQPFKTRYPLFEGQGNYGSPDNPNSVAASRYIECRLTEFCEKFYLNSSDYADREDNYDGRLKEVTRYYPPIPGSLLTGSSGIAVGLSTNIPTHTIKDVCISLLAYIKNPNSDRYIELIYPETCEESIILTPKKDIEKIYRTGEGSIQYKAKTHYESIDGKLALIVDAFPPDYRKKSLETSYILEAVEAGNLELRNESKEGIRYVFLSDNKEVLEKVEERLVSSTGYRMYIEHNGKIKCYKLSELYDDFIEAKTQYILRKYTDLVRKNDEEIKFIDILLEFKKDRDYIKSMFDKSRDEVIADIIVRYGAPKEVAIRIISSSLSSMLKDNTDKLLLKRKDLVKQTQEYQGYLDDPIKKIQLDIKELLNEYKDEKRRATHIDDVQEFITINYDDITIKAHPSSVYYVATHDNNYTKVHATELLEMDLIDKIVVSSEFDYYVFYDSKGLIAVTKEIMDRMDNKFKSSYLIDIIGTNNLEDISLIRSNTNRVISLGEWALRTRLSYIKQVDEDHTISLVAQSSEDSRY